MLNDRGRSRKTNINHKPKITFKKLINILENDLNKLIRALEIYLTDYVEKIEIEKISPNILSLEIDKVINFNYTDTYQRIYEMDNNIEYDYIHGKANIDNTIERSYIRFYETIYKNHG